MPNFSSLACFKVAEKFGVVLGGEHVATMSNSNASCFELSLGVLRSGLTILFPQLNNHLIIDIFVSKLIFFLLCSHFRFV